MDSLSCSLNFLDSSHLCKGIKLPRHSPSVSHPFFADGCLIFFEPTPESCIHLCSTLSNFNLYSGQCINHAKSFITFCPNTPIPFPGSLGFSFASLLRKRSLSTWGFLWKLPQRQKIVSDSSLKMFRPGWVVGKPLYLPMYLCSTVNLPISLCVWLNALSASFWWKSSDCKLVYWLALDNLFAYKSEGGLGNCDLRFVNQALLANQCWCLLNDRSPYLFISQVVLQNTILE